MSFKYLSCPVDHHDPWIQQRFKDNEISTVLSQFTKSLVTASNLRRLGDQLAPSKQTFKVANKVVDKVISMVGGCDLFSIDRWCVSGSFGKRTALCNFDIDLIFFVKKETPPFKSVLSELENHLRCVVPRIEMKRTTGISVQFIMDGFNVDLLPAPNLVDGPVAFKASEQYARALEKIKAIPAKDIVKDVRIWSPALAETTVQFMKKQSAFVNAAVRLAKLWKASCKTLSSTFPVWFSSFLVEIIASDAAKTELADHPNDASLVRVLEHFLMMLSMPDQLCIATIENECPTWISKKRPLVWTPSIPIVTLRRSCMIGPQFAFWPYRHWMY